MCSRPLYLLCMAGLPLLCCVLFVTMFWQGLPTQVPTAVVDLDHSSMSRSVVRALEANQFVNVTMKCDTYSQGHDAVQSGKCMGMFVIPANFERDAISGRTATIDYYCNMTYFVAGTFSMKGYKSIAVATAAQVVSAAASEKGIPASTVKALVQPLNLDINAIHNPWPNYNVYLTPSFVSAVIALMIVMVTIFSITGEIKENTSRIWMARSGNSVMLALFGRLVPQTVFFLAIQLLVQAIMYGYCGFPLYCSVGWILLSSLLFVIANQAFGVFIASLLPNPRLSLSLGALLSILAFSFTGFSFPVEQMYGAIAIFSYIMPVRYFFLIYSQQALNGFDIYFVRTYYVALLIFPLVSLLLLPRLRKALLKPVYVP